MDTLVFGLIVLPLNIKIVCDYDDAIFHRYDQNRSMTIRKLLGNKIDKLWQQLI